MRWFRILSISLAMVSASSFLGAAEIDRLSALWNAGTIAVSFNLDRAFDDEQIRQALQSGLPTGFTYHIELIRKRPNWFDDTVDDVTIEVVATFNSVTREYLLNYRRDRRLVRSETLSNLQELQQRMTAISEDMMFSRVRQAPNKLRVRVRADVLRGYLLYVIPWDVSTNWEEVRVKRRAAAQPSSAVTAPPRNP